MAWTAPRTWVVGELVSHTLMNPHVRDNLLALDQHKHSGVGGDGNASLVGVDSLTTDDISAPAAPGANKAIFFSSSGAPHVRFGAAGADLTISDTSHTHAAAD